MGRVRRPTARLRRAHMMRLDPGDPPGEGVGSRVADEMHRATSVEKLDGQRLGREQMTAGPAGREHKAPAHSSPPPSRRRVSASIIPIPSPSASIEDPP